MTFVFVVFAGRVPSDFEVISGFYCDEAGKTSIDQVVERAKERYCTTKRCSIESLQMAVDTIEFGSDADFPMFRRLLVQ
jgi:hypothetical protein